MSTQYEILKTPNATLVLDERSSLFDLDVETAHAVPLTIAHRLTAEEVVDLAMRLIQPTLYNVADPEAFMESIRAKLGRLFV